MPDHSPDQTGLSRARLLRVLALDPDASPGQIRRRGERLLSTLRERGEPDAAALREIEALERSLIRHARGPRTDGHGPRRRSRQPGDRLTALAILLGMLVASFAFWSMSKPGDPGDASPALGALLHLAPSRLVLTGSLPECTLRVLDGDRVKLLHERPAQDAVVELQPGRYAVEVSRPGCSQTWTQSLYLEPGTTRTFAPSLCSGEGTLRVHTNVEGAQILVDGEPIDATRAPGIALPSGDHVLAIEKAGYRRHEEQIRIHADQTRVRRVDLIRERPGAEEGAGTGTPSMAAAAALPAAPKPAPEPFDMRELRDSLAPPRPERPDSTLLQRAGLGALPDGGSTAWHDRVSREFLLRFDRDGSGRIDRIEENDEISCAYWQETEASFDRGGLGLSMARYYGFDGSEWHSGALGFDRMMRGAAYDRMRSCGLQA